MDNVQTPKEMVQCPVCKAWVTFSGNPPTLDIHANPNDNSLCPNTWYDPNSKPVLMDMFALSTIEGQPK